MRGEIARKEEELKVKDASHGEEIAQKNEALALKDEALAVNNEALSVKDVRIAALERLLADYGSSAGTNKRKRC